MKNNGCIAKIISGIKHQMVDSLHKRGRHHGNKLTITRSVSDVKENKNQKRKKGEFQPWCYKVGKEEDPNFGNPVTNEQGTYVPPVKKTKFIKSTTSTAEENKLRQQIEDLQKQLAEVSLCVYFPLFFVTYLTQRYCFYRSHRLINEKGATRGQAQQIQMNLMKIIIMTSLASN